MSGELAISALGMAPDRPFWLRFELRAADPKDLADVVGESGISLSGLIEFFSRQPARRAALDARAGPLAPGGPAAHVGPRVANRVNRLRNRLILIFLAATLAPLAATVWITTSLLEESLDYSSTSEAGHAVEIAGRAPGGNSISVPATI